MQFLLDNRFFKNVLLLFCSVLSFSLTGCKDDDDKLPMPESEPLARVAFFQASPNALDMDIWIGEQKASNQPFGFSDYSPYASFNAGSYRYRFNPVNAANSYIDSTLTFEKNKRYTLFTVGEFQDIQLLMVEDSLIKPAAGNAALRLINLSPDAAGVDVVTTGGSAETLFSDVVFKEDTEFVELNAGAHSFKIKQAGGEEELLSLSNYNLQANRNYTFILRGYKNPPAGNTNMLGIQSIIN